MGISSLQVCMDSSDWSSLQGAISEVNTGLMDSPPVATPNNDNNNDILACSRPLIESRRLRPNHEQALKCPRCESTHTKFCYYNNYSLTQPRYFCKTCRRYWTKGGTLRNIPVGGGCRKNKKVSSSSKKPSSSSTSSDHNNNNNPHRPSSSLVNRNRDINPDPQDFQHLHFSSFNNPGFLFENMIPNPVEFVDNNNGVQNPSGHHHDNYLIGYNNPFGLMSNSFDNPGVGPNDNVLESCQRLMLPNHDYHENYRPNHDYHYDHQNHRHHEVGDVKPNAKVLSLEWHDCNSDAGIKDSFGYNLGGLGSWTGLMGGYGSSATNPLV